MHKITTVRDAALPKILADAYAAQRAADKAAKQAAKKAEIDAILAANQQIGRLSSGRFYVFPVGGKYVEASHPSKLLAA